MITRRTILGASLGAGLSVTRRALGDDYPSRSIRVIVPFVAGGGTDLLMRLVGQVLSARLGRQLVIENVGGAGGTIGAMEAVNAPANGYTLLCGTPGSIAINPVVQPDIGYQPLRDLAPVAQLTDSPIVLVCNNKFDLTSVADLIARAKAAPNAISFGSAGPGSMSHLSGLMFCAITGVQLLHVPYRGTGQSLMDLRAGRIQVLFENMPAVMTSISNGDVKAIAVGTAQKSDLLPHLPTIAESGAPGYVSSSYMGLLAPAKTPAAIVGTLSKACAGALSDPALTGRLRTLGVTPAASDADAFTAFIRQRVADMTQLVKQTGLKFD